MNSSSWWPVLGTGSKFGARATTSTKARKDSAEFHTRFLTNTTKSDKVNTKPLKKTHNRI